MNKENFLKEIANKFKQNQQQIDQQKSITLWFKFT